jgi:hypothetical protein
VIFGSGIVTLAVALLLVAALGVAGCARATAATLANTNNQAHDLDDRGQIVGLRAQRGPARDLAAVRLASGTLDGYWTFPIR